MKQPTFLETCLSNDVLKPDYDVVLVYKNGHDFIKMTTLSPLHISRNYCIVSAILCSQFEEKTRQMEARLQGEDQTCQVQEMEEELQMAKEVNRVIKLNVIPGTCT